MENFQHDDDPFFWDVEAVLKELCTMLRPCTRDPASLANRIREHWMDGQALLTLDLVCSQKELFDSLGINLGGHKAALARAILNLRSRSPAFRSWKLQLERETSQLETDLSLPTVADQASAPSRPPAGSDNQAVLDDHTEQVVREERLPTGSRPLQSLLDNSPSNEGEGQARRPAKHRRSSLLDHDQGLGSGELPHGASQKRRRLQPTQLSTDIPDASTSSSTFPWEAAAADAYLGEGAMSVSFILSTNYPLTTQVIEQEDTFFTKFPIRLPTGRRISVSRTMKRYLLDNSRTGGNLSKSMPREHHFESPEDGDKILSLLDLPDSVDEETAIEMEMEKSQFQPQLLCIDKGRVETILSEEISQFEANWQERKRPKYLYRAHKIWFDAMRKGRKNSEAIEARKRLRFYHDRVQKLCSEILAQTWTKESEVRHQARCLQQSVEDRLHSRWLADLLESRQEPQRMPSMPRPPTKKGLPQPNFTDDEEGEVLTSSDDEPMMPDEHENSLPVEDPIPDNCVPAVTNADEADLNDNEAPLYIDLTQSESPEKAPSKKRREVTDGIDLLNPVSSRPALQPTADRGNSRTCPAANAQDDSEESWLAGFDSITKHSATYWAKKGVREKLVICLLWKLTHSRRAALFKAARDLTPSTLYEESISKQLSHPVSDLSQLGQQASDTLAFDMTRLYLSFLRVKYCRQKRVKFLPDPDIKKLKQKGEKWETFCGFLKMVAPSFPQEDQIYRADTPDEDSGGGDGDDAAADSQETPSRRRKQGAKEIVRNKDAVDLREKEKRRLEEHEARKAKLRAALATADWITRDKSRLIINESKQEDQSFIYVNEEIGKRIKDHQIAGVRFLWNQIILDDESHQGCLLAHTMGLGKTMQVITFLVAVQDAAKSTDPTVSTQIPEDLRESRTLVICPSGLVDNWMDEFLTWAPDGLLGQIYKVEALMLREERRAVIREWASAGGILLLGYRMLWEMSGDAEIGESSLTEGPNLVVADEAHFLKNPEAKVTQLCARIRTKRRIALTGSPLANNVEEYFSMINWVAPNYLGPLGEFREIYANPIQQGLWGDSLGWEKRQALKMLQVLKETVAPKVHRATIKSCLKDDLPPKQEFVICVPPTALQRKLYEIYLSGYKSEHLADGADKKLSQGHLFGCINSLVNLCNHPRCFRQTVLEARKSGDGSEYGQKTLPDEVISALLKETNSHDLDNSLLSVKTELLSLILDEARRLQEKVLVFSHSLATLDYLMNLLRQERRRVCRLDGSTAIGKRQDMIKKFNSGDQEVYLISTGAGGVGLNIQGANRVVIFDLKWNPVEEQQAIGRAYRIGQEKAVFVYRFIVAGTFEEELQNKAVFKMQLASRVVDKKNPVSWSKRLGSLLDPPKTVAARSLAPFKGKDVILDRLIGYKSGGEAIRYIVSTDTFEEEDSKVDLTAEERRHAEDMVKLNRLRVTDPKEYERRREGELQRQMQMQMPMGPRPEMLQQLAAQRSAAASNVLAVMGMPTVPRHWTMGQEGTGARSEARPCIRVAGRGSNVLEGPGDGGETVMTGESAGSSSGGGGGGVGTVDGGPTGEQADGATATGGSSEAKEATTSTTTTLLPMVGANTYFGKVNGAEAKASGAFMKSTSTSAPTTTMAMASATTAATTSKAIFGPPGRSRAMEAFEAKLRFRMQTLPRADAGMDGGARARRVTEAINKAQAELALGFLPNNQRWQVLGNLLGQERFLLATVSGYWRAAYLAQATTEALIRRLKVLNSLSEDQFRAQLGRATREPDPENLQNLGRYDEAVASERVREDLAVMREAADQRRRRATMPKPTAAGVERGGV